ncbi:TetR family transcriptional regulator [Paenibacillus anseongense]|uniref:TetR family transcriptional regulator n=1 Tax=Paenibacillus anseongense TaxID=2682845 RepID=UPI002DBF7DE5|nr:TetR family transcriptional regulator [Paenibacillus anseongense]MEC0264851.1 TetR family transcriptional regulator [Paenibacillus anseongense]
MMKMGTKVLNVRNTQTKQSLINAFLQLVSEKDFEKIRIADISQRAQVNRATFYAHFNDKYELLDYMIGDSASAAIVEYTSGTVKFDQDNIKQLVLCACYFYKQPKIKCRSSYIGLVVPQLKEKMLNELKIYLMKSLGNTQTEIEKTFYVPVFANMINEGEIQWASGNVLMNQEEVARRVSVLVIGGYQAIELR